jgi:hypothetical protein
MLATLRIAQIGWCNGLLNDWYMVQLFGGKKIKFVKNSCDVELF